MLNPRVQIIGVIWTAGIIQGGHGYLVSSSWDVDVVGWFHDVCGSILLRVCFLISFHFSSNHIAFIGISFASHNSRILASLQFY